MGWGEDQFEAAWLAGEKASGLARAVGGVIVEQDADQQSHRIARVELLEKGDELARTMSLGDSVMHNTADKIDGGGKCDRAEPLIFMIALDSGMLAWPGRQVG